MANTDNPIDPRPLSALTPEALSMLDDLVAQSGWNQTPRDWRVFLRHGAIYVVRHAGGHIMASGAVLPMGDRAAWISMILVERASRGKGLGRAVFEHSLRAVQDMGRKPWLDATPEGERLYSQYGFAPLWRLARWTRAAAPDAAPAPPQPAPDLQALADLDARALGFSRGQVLADLAAREGSRVVRQAQAFAIVRAGRVARYVGPLLANDEAAAASLLEDICAGTPEPIFIDVPEARPTLHRKLRELGFARQRGFTRMALGEDAPQGLPAFIHAIAGPEYG